MYAIGSYVVASEAAVTAQCTLNCVRCCRSVCAVDNHATAMQTIASKTIDTRRAGIPAWRSNRT